MGPWGHFCGKEQNTGQGVASNHKSLGPAEGWCPASVVGIGTQHFWARVPVYLVTERAMQGAREDSER